MTAIRQPATHTTEEHLQSADPTAADNKETTLQIHPAADVLPMLGEDAEQGNITWH